MILVIRSERNNHFPTKHAFVTVNITNSVLHTTPQPGIHLSQHFSYQIPREPTADEWQHIYAMWHHHSSLVVRAYQ